MEDISLRVEILSDIIANILHGLLQIVNSLPVKVWSFFLPDSSMTHSLHSDALAFYAPSRYADGEIPLHFLKLVEK